MTELTGAAASPMVKLPIDYDSQADTTSEGDHKKIVDAAPSTKPLFSKRQGVDIIIYVYRDIYFILDEFTQWHIIPSKEWRLANHPLRGIHNTCQSYTYSH